MKRQSSCHWKPASRFALRAVCDGVVVERLVVISRSGARIRLCILTAQCRHGDVAFGVGIRRSFWPVAQSPAVWRRLSRGKLALPRVA